MIRSIINLYILLLIVDAVLSYIPALRGHQIVKGVRKAADFTLEPVRKILPPDLPFDPSPLIVIFGLQVFMALW